MMVVEVGLKPIENRQLMEVMLGTGGVAENVRNNNNDQY
jgi:hypothetical protein